MWNVSKWEHAGNFSSHFMKDDMCLGKKRKRFCNIYIWWDILFRCVDFNLNKWKKEGRFQGNGGLLVLGKNYFGLNHESSQPQFSKDSAVNCIFKLVPNLRQHFKHISDIIINYVKGVGYQLSFWSKREIFWDWWWKIRYWEDSRCFILWSQTNQSTRLGQPSTQSD